MSAPEFLASSLEAISSIVERNKTTFSAKQAREINELLIDAKTTPLRIVLLGPFSSGKSSLVNSLLGRPILPTGLSETTATSFRVRIIIGDVPERIDVPTGQSLGQDLYTVFGNCLSENVAPWKNFILTHSTTRY